MADTSGYFLEDSLIEFSTATEVAPNVVTESSGFFLEDSLIEFATSTEVAISGVVDSSGFFLEDSQIDFATITTPVPGSSLPSSRGYFLEDIPGLVDIYKYLPTESAFEIWAFPLVIVRTIPRRTYEGDILLIPGEQFDISVPNGDLDRDATLETAIYLSLLTDRRAHVDELLPVKGDVRGWWADTQVGSKIWLYGRSKINDTLLSLLAQECVEGLSWLVEDGVARTVNVLVTKQNENTVALKIRITLPRRITREFNFYYNIEQQLLR